MFEVNQEAVHIFGIPKICMSFLCTSNVVQYVAWWWIFESKHVATL